MLLDPLRMTTGVQWSAAVHDATGPLDALHPETVLPTASIGKVLLLVAVAEAMADATLDPDERIDPVADDLVADSGLLQHLSDQTLRVDDLARFVGAVSDNLATNILLRRVGLDTVSSLGERLGLRDTALHDQVRDVRVAGTHPPYLSSGCAGELVTLVDRLATGDVVSQEVSAVVRRWLALNTDSSMVASGFALDPLAHVAADFGVVLFNKTGTQVGTRADIGCATTASGDRISFAVIARFTDDYPTRRAVLHAMGAVGERLRAVLLGESAAHSR